MTLEQTIDDAFERLLKYGIKTGPKQSILDKVDEIIGETEPETIPDKYHGKEIQRSNYEAIDRNIFRAEQRRRAGLKEKS